MRPLAALRRPRGRRGLAALGVGACALPRLAPLGLARLRCGPGPRRGCARAAAQRRASLLVGEPGAEPAPRVAWSYWDKGFDALSDFRRLCVETWEAQNPDWEVRVLDRESVFDYLEPAALPRLWGEMYVPWQADAVRLALLAQYGGLWIDVSTICLRPFGGWMYDAVASAERPEGIGAFYFAAWGVDMHESREYVENWLIAARRGHPMILAWRDVFNGYWDSKRRADAMSIFLDPPGVPEHPLFEGVDLGHLKRFGQDLRNYLLMHAAFKKLIDEDPGMRRIWREEMVLLRAEDTAFWHMEEPQVAWSVDELLWRLLGPCDARWLARVVGGCPVLKFTREAANALDPVPRDRCLAAATGLGEVLRAALRPASGRGAPAGGAGSAGGAPRRPRGWPPRAP